MNKSVARTWVALAILAAGALVAWLADDLPPATATEDILSDALKQLGVLYILALFVERAIEVFIKAWRQAERWKLEKTVETASPRNRVQAEQKLQAYRAGTKRAALLVGLTIGIMISLAGVRILDVVFSGITGDFQLFMFRFTDVLVTAGLIAGGSSLIHELMTLITEFLRESRPPAKAGVS